MASSTPDDGLHFGLERIRRLLALYGELEQGWEGRTGQKEPDLLRAAVVLLHALLEDLIRELAARRLPASNDVFLSRIPFVGGDGRNTKLTLGDLASYRGRPVDEVISKSIDAYLDRRSYNDTNDLAGALSEMGMSPGLVAPHAVALQALMLRRHNVAHRMDRDKPGTSGRHEPRVIDRESVESWLGAVEAFGRTLLVQLDTVVSWTEGDPDG